MIRCWFLSFFIGVCSLLATTLLPSTQKKPLPHASLSLGASQLDVTIAANEASREEGLMKKATLGTNEGMLFIFPRAQRVAFWMKDTPLPLSIAYLTSTGRILEIHDLEPFDEHSILSSSSAIVYALEVPRGWFGSHHVLPNDQINGLPSFSSAE